MLKFEGRTSQKIIIPGKPIPTGFKLFALGDSDYIYNWECTKPGIAEGILREKKKSFYFYSQFFNFYFFKSHSISGNSACKFSF